MKRLFKAIFIRHSSSWTSHLFQELCWRSSVHHGDISYKLSELHGGGHHPISLCPHLLSLHRNISAWNPFVLILCLSIYNLQVAFIYVWHCTLFGAMLAYSGYHEAKNKHGLFPCVTATPRSLGWFSLELVGTYWYKAEMAWFAGPVQILGLVYCGPVKDRSFWNLSLGPTVHGLNFEIGPCFGTTGPVLTGPSAISVISVILANP